MKRGDSMQKILINTKNLYWYQRLILLINYYTYDLRHFMSKREILIYKDKNVKGYMQFRRRNILFHTKKRNKNKIFNRWDDKYFIV